MEHLHHFQLAKDPFRNEPMLESFLETRCHGDALRRLERGVRQSRGLCVLTGETGAGKTMILRQLHENLEEEIFDASMLVVLPGRVDASWLLQRFARQLGAEDVPQDRDALVAQVYEQLAIIREDGRHAVLIIDDAQALASQETLEDVCGLLKLEYEERRLLTLVLAGGPKLDAAFSDDGSFSHRVDIKVRVEPLDADSARAYLQHRIECARGPASVIDASAQAALQRLGGGLPGRMNTLADNALYEAFLANRPAMTGADVERAAADLGWGGAVAPIVHAPAMPTAQVAPVSPLAAASPVQTVVVPAAAVPHATPAAAMPAGGLGDDPLAATQIAFGEDHAPSTAESLGNFDSALEAVFDSVQPAAGLPTAEPFMPAEPLSASALTEIDLGGDSAFMPAEGPPKDEEDAGLLVELLED